MAAAEKVLSEKYLLGAGKYPGMGHLYSHNLFYRHGAERRIIHPDFYFWCVIIWLNYRRNTDVGIERKSSVSQGTISDHLKIPRTRQTLSNCYL